MTATEHLGPQFSGYQRITVPIASLVAEHDSMSGVIKSGRTSKTPGPVLLKARSDNAGYELADGHHRVADAMRAGQTHITGDLDSTPDDEPYSPPFYDFRASMGQ